MGSLRSGEIYFEARDVEIFQGEQRRARMTIKISEMRKELKKWDDEKVRLQNMKSGGGS